VGAGQGGKAALAGEMVEKPLPIGRAVGHRLS
jgi:hypothetical protein